MRVPGLMLLVAVASFPGGCATTSTRPTPIAPERVHEEEQNQREIVVQELTTEQQRLDAIAFPILVAGTELCPDRSTWQWGLRFDHALTYEADWQAAARIAGIGDSVTVVSVVPESPAEAAGLRVSDRILAIDGADLSGGKAGFDEASQAVEEARERDGRLQMRVRRDEADLDVDMQAVQGCGFGHVVTVEGGINAYADGTKIIVPWAMMRFAQEEELQVVVAHEIAHNAMNHVGAKKKNALLGGILGVIGDIALASAGIDTRGFGTEQGFAMGANAFSQDFEREADYVGMYFLARAGLTLTHAPGLWRHFAQIDPGAIAFASTHPTTAERFVRLEQVTAEIEAKRADGRPLLPEMKDGR